MEPAIREHAERMFSNLSENMGNVLDLRVYFFAWTTDFVTGQIFRSPAGLFWDPKRAKEWFTIMWTFSAHFGLAKHTPWMVPAGLALPLAVFKAVFPSLAPYVAVYKVGIFLPWHCQKGRSPTGCLATSVTSTY